MANREIEVYERDDGTWDWRLWSGGDIIATSGGQGYENKKFAFSMAAQLFPMTPFRKDSTEE